MALHLARIYAAIVPANAADHGLSYSVSPIHPDMPRYYIGKSSDGAASILVSVRREAARMRTPIRLENLEVQFNVIAAIRRDGKVSEGVFTIVRCRSDNAALIDYFLTITEALIGILGAEPADLEIASVVNRLAMMFQQLRNPPSRSIAGLFGELFVIRQGRDHVAAVRSWRLEETSRFDFATGDLRLDAKTTSGRLRSHIFSYDQCNPPSRTVAFVASMFVERLDEGMALKSLLADLEISVGSHPDLLFKLRETVATTLGSFLAEALQISFDLRLAQSSLRFFDLREIPAIRTALPPGISGVQFHSDLSGAVPLSFRDVERRCEAMATFLPRQ